MKFVDDDDDDDCGCRGWYDSPQSALRTQLLKYGPMHTSSSIMVHYAALDRTGV